MDTNLKKDILNSITLLIVLELLIYISIKVTKIEGVITQPQKIEVNPTIELSDSIINKQPKFYTKTPQEGLKEALSYYNLEHKDIVYAQAILETGNFKSEICLKNNNLFGLYDSRNKKYYKYKHWSESIKDYKELIQSKYQPPNNYYIFLEKLNYAENKNYTKILKAIVNKNKENDKRRDT